MSKKIVFFDIDDTLVNEKKEIPLSAKEAIHELKNNGVYVAIATARPPFLFEDIRKELEIDSYVSFNGQYVVFKQELIYENPLNKEKLKQLFDATKRYNYPMAFVSEREMRATVPDHPFIKKSILLSEYPKVDNEYFLKEKIYQALMYCKADEERELREAHKDFYFQRWHKYSCDIIPGGGSKAIGVQKILESGGFHIDESYAFGDGINDMEMLQSIGTGIAMGNATEDLKNIADFVTTSVNNDGIMRGLKHFNLIGKEEVKS